MKAFFTGRLKVWFELDSPAAEDAEPFGFDRLQEFSLGDELLQAALSAEDLGHAEASFAECKRQQQRRGQLPLAGFANPAQERYADPAWSAYALADSLFAAWPHAAEAPLEIAFEFNPDSETPRLEDWLPGLRRDGQGRHAQILVRPQAVTNKDGKPKWHNLIRPWVCHLAACATGLDLTTFQVGPEGMVKLPPLLAETALDCLCTLCQAWQAGMKRPLPLACKTAFAWLANSEAPQDAAAKQYEGGYNHAGEVRQDVYLARAFPSFERLMAEEDGSGFESWLERVYGPLWKAWHEGQ